MKPSLVLVLRESLAHDEHFEGHAFIVLELIIGSKGVMTVEIGHLSDLNSLLLLFLLNASHLNNILFSRPLISPFF